VKFQTINKNEQKRLARLIALLLFLCVNLGALPIFSFQSSKQQSDLIFCPLMKVWVTKGKSSAERRKIPLKDICASDEDKQDFFFAGLTRAFLFAKTNFDSNQIEQIFFSYAKKGVQAFAEISDEQNQPSPQFANSSGVVKSLAGFEKEFGKTQTEKFVLSQFARPPNSSNSPVFDSKIFHRLDKISRRIQPRAPPVSV
jgi:hypothetical protein